MGYNTTNLHLCDIGDFNIELIKKMFIEVDDDWSFEDPENNILPSRYKSFDDFLNAMYDKEDEVYIANLMEQLQEGHGSYSIQFTYIYEQIEDRYLIAISYLT